MQNLKRINSKNTENSKKIQYISSALYSIAPVTNYQNIIALKQQQYINLQFWVSLGVGKMTYFLKVEAIITPSLVAPSICKARNSNSNLSQITLH